MNNIIDFTLYAKEYYRRTELTAKHFFAVRIDDTLYPITENGKNVFIYGKGLVKVGKKHKVPVFSGLVSDFDNYVAQYGYYCLEYSLLGYVLNPSDCCARNTIQELANLQYYGTEKFCSYMEKAIQLDNIVTEKLNSFGVSYKDFVERNRLLPCMNFRGFTYPVHFDVIEDDGKLVETFIEMRKAELNKNVSDFEYNSHWEKVQKEVEEVFPVSMKERITFLYGKTATKLYKELMNGIKTETV